MKLEILRITPEPTKDEAAAIAAALAKSHPKAPSKKQRVSAWKLSARIYD